MRIVASEPNRAELLLLDQLIASAARETLWLADAYYAGVPSHFQALRSAALDGVDVRLMLPGTTDLPVVRAMSRAGYRPLLEAGVRIFEWNGPMLHSKTAVADGRWARVGSSNLNIASWLANYELDAVIEDAGFAETMAEPVRVRPRELDRGGARKRRATPTGQAGPRPWKRGTHGAVGDPAREHALGRGDESPNAGRPGGGNRRGGRGIRLRPGGAGGDLAAAYRDPVRGDTGVAWWSAAPESVAFAPRRQRGATLATAWVASITLFLATKQFTIVTSGVTLRVSAAAF